MTLYRHELRMNLKSLFIWTACVGGLCFACILMYTSLQDSLQNMADAYSNMGAFSTAFGMDKISIATLTGFYATEIGIMHSLGGAMFAALTGILMLSKEEAGHTAEFLNVFPKTRTNMVLQKYCALITNVVLFNIICVALYILGFAFMKEQVPVKEFTLYHITQLLMQIEIASICFMISAFGKKNQVGLGLGIAIILYAADMMCRIIPAIKNVKYITPFYYSNASDIFSASKINIVMIVIGVTITIVSLIIAVIRYKCKDVAS